MSLPAASIPVSKPPIFKSPSPGPAATTTTKNLANASTGKQNNANSIDLRAAKTCRLWNLEAAQRKNNVRPEGQAIENKAEKLVLKAPEKPVEKPPEKSAEKMSPNKPISNRITPQQNKNITKKKRKELTKREQMKENDLLRSDSFTWKVVKLLGSGGFGDVYKVVKENNVDKQEYALKTEMCEGDRRLLRLKIEVYVLGICKNIGNPEKRKHFIELIDRGKTNKFKFLVMGLVGPSLEDIRKNIVCKNFSRSTAMQASFQTLQAIADLHDIGYLHRDIKPQNFAVGLGQYENTIYILDFGIARKFTIGETKQVKKPRLHVKFLGTIRFASRACHHGIEQGRKDDLESWIYMVYDMLDDRHGLPWKHLRDRLHVVIYKEKFFRFQFPNCYSIVPSEFKRLVEYVNGMTFAEEPDYTYMTHSIKSIAKQNHIDMEKKLDWIGRSKNEKRTSQEESDETSEDNRYTGSDESEETEKQSRTKKFSTRRKVVMDTQKKSPIPKNL